MSAVCHTLHLYTKFKISFPKKPTIPLCLFVTQPIGGPSHMAREGHRSEDGGVEELEWVSLHEADDATGAPVAPEGPSLARDLVHSALHSLLSTSLSISC